MSSSNPLIEGDVDIEKPGENKRKVVKLQTKLPAEINKNSVVQYLRKDVAKTKLYRSLPLYLMFLVITSTSLVLQKEDAPTEYWLSMGAREVLLGPKQTNQLSQYENINGINDFYEWLYAQTSSTYIGGKSSEPVTEYLSIRQFRGKSSMCQSDPQLSVLSPHSRLQFSGICQLSYSDSSPNTHLFGPSNRFAPNKDVPFPFKAPPYQGVVDSYSDSDNSFSIKIKSRSEEEELTAYVQSKANKTNNIETCGNIASNQECVDSPVCGWNGLCTTKRSECSLQTDSLNCTSRSCLWSEITTSCYMNCISMSQDDCLLADGCAYNGSCYDPRPQSVQVIDMLQSSNWLDPYSRAVSVDLLEYNTHSQYFLFTTYFIEVLPVGVWLPKIKSYPFRILALYSPIMKALFALDVLTTVYIAWTVVSVFLQIRHNAEVGKVSNRTVKEAATEEQPELVEKHQKSSAAISFLKRYLNAITFTVMYGICFSVVFLIALGLKWSLWSDGIELINRNFNDIPTDVADVKVWNDMVDYITLFKTEKTMYATAVLLAWLRLFEYVQYNERLNSLTETIRIATSSLIGLAIIFGIIFVGFVFAGNLVYGSDLEEFSTLLKTAGFMMRLLFSAELDSYEKFRSVEPEWSIVYFGLFFALAWLVLLNMVLAIITSSFNIVKQNATKGKAPSWSLPAVMTDVKKFLNRFTTRTQPFTFSNSIKRKKPKTDENEGGQLDNLVGDNYVVDRIKAIRILEEKSSSNLKATNTNSSDPDDDKKNYITLPALNTKLSHLHPSENRRIFVKCGNDSAGTQQMRQSQRIAEYMSLRFEHIEEILSNLSTQVGDQEYQLKSNSSDILSMKADARQVKDEIGIGKVETIRQTVDNIDNNVYVVPKQVGSYFNRILDKKLSKLQSEVNQPIDHMIDDMAFLIEQVYSPTLLKPPKHSAFDKHVLVKPEKVAILSSPKANLQHTNPIHQEFSPLQTSLNKVTLIKGTIDVSDGNSSSRGEITSPV